MIITLCVHDSVSLSHSSIGYIHNTHGMGSMIMFFMMKIMQYAQTVYECCESWGVGIIYIQYILEICKQRGMCFYWESSEINKLLPMLLRLISTTPNLKGQVFKKFCELISKGKL